jgi:D-aminopeptidase
MSRDRIRNLGIRIGRLPIGQHNAITDVPGVLVGHCTIIHDQPRIARTGVTLIIPRAGHIWDNYAFAGYHSFNGNGEMTGLLWLEESGMLGSAIGITNTHSVGIVRDALTAYWIEQGNGDGFLLPVVAETYDGWLNDINAFHVTKEHVYQAIAAATSGEVAEGNVGGGTGMICHAFKGGIGTASRLVFTPNGTYTVGVLVQANYGERHSLRMNGIPIGEEIGIEQVPSPWQMPDRDGSIIVIIATDAPLLPVQCQRLAKRATLGLARVGGMGYNSSGDIFLAFATGNDLPANCSTLRSLQMLPHDHLNGFFEAVAEAVEEAILNALTKAETMTGLGDRVAYALPLDELQRIWRKYQSLR